MILDKYSPTQIKMKSIKAEYEHTIIEINVENNWVRLIAQ